MRVDNLHVWKSFVVLRVETHVDDDENHDDADDDCDGA